MASILLPLPEIKMPKFIKFSTIMSAVLVNIVLCSNILRICLLNDRVFTKPVVPKRWYFLLVNQFADM